MTCITVQEQIRDKIGRGEISTGRMLTDLLEQLQQIAGVIRLAREIRPTAAPAKQAEIDEMIATLQAEFDRCASARASMLDLLAGAEWSRR